MSIFYLQVVYLFHRVKYKLFCLISFWINFLLTDNFGRFLGNSPKNLRKRSIYRKFPHQEITWKSLYFTLCLFIYQYIFILAFLYTVSSRYKRDYPAPPHWNKTHLHQKKKKTTHRPYLQTQGWVTANKQIFKSSLKQNILDI